MSLFRLGEGLFCSRTCLIGFETRGALCLSEDVCDNGWHFGNLGFAENFSVFVQQFRTESGKPSSEGQPRAVLNPK